MGEKRLCPDTRVHQKDTIELVEIEAFLMTLEDVLGDPNPISTLDWKLSTLEQ